MVDVTGQTIQWKKLWQLIAGNYYQTPHRIVLQRLQEASKDLIDGVKTNLPSTNTSTTTTIVDIPTKIKEKCPEKLQKFLQKLQQFLNINYERSWDLLCMYISEYQGSGSSLSNCLSTEANMTQLLQDVWEYNSLERMAMLKIVKNLLEFSTSPRHPYANEYATFLTEITVERIRRSYIDQFEYLINEQPPNKMVAGEFFNTQQKLIMWSERRCREMKEILQIILLAISRSGLLPKEFKRLVLLFKSHSFGRQCQFLDNCNKQHSDLIYRITYCEVALFLKCCDVMNRCDPSTFIGESVSMLEKDIVSMYQHPEHGPILLGWMLFNFGAINDIEEVDIETSTKYIQFGTRASRLGVFEYLNSMLRHHMFRDKSEPARITRRTVLNHLSRLCDLFDGDGSVCQHPKIYDLLCVLLETPSIAKEFSSNESIGIRSLYNTALENFSIDFISLSTIAHALATAGPNYAIFVQQQLFNLPLYTECFNANRVLLKPSPDADDEFILCSDYLPFRRIDYTIPIGTHAIISDKQIDKQYCTVIHFRYPVNYFNVLHNEINELLLDAVKYAEINDVRRRRVTAGLKYLSVAVKRIQNPMDITKEMVHPTEMVFDILMKFKMVTNPPIELLARCMDVCEALLGLFQEEILKRIISVDILPYVANLNLDFHSYGSGASFDSGLVGLYLINYEKKIGKYDFLIAYLQFVKKVYSMVDTNELSSIELPCLIFLLREVFPHVHTWRFINESDRIQIYTIVMQCFFDILQITSEQLRCNHQKLVLRNTCVYSLLNIDNAMALLRFIAVGNDFVQKIMQNESNWMIASNSDFNLLVRLSMTLLMQLLRLRKEVVQDDTQLSPLESIICTQPKQRDTLRIIPVVTSYMNNIFNRSLPILSCRLLRRFALEFRMSLLACLDMEAEQIRLTFLLRLRDDLENDDLKIAIIELVEACINKQPGLTEAFFKLDYKNEHRFLAKIHKTKNIGDGILTYMTEYLDAIKTDSSSVASKLLSRMMALFHALWRNNMQTLVQKLIDQPTFWPSLMNPLFGPIKPNIPAYSQLFNVIGIELFRCSPTHSIAHQFKKTVEKFLQPHSFQNWIDSILNIPDECVENDDLMLNETSEWLCRLQSFKDLVIILLRRPYHGVILSPENHKYFTEKCLAALAERSKYTDDLRPFIVLSELYWFLLISLGPNEIPQSEQEEDQMLSRVKMLFNDLSNSYQDIHPRARESILAIVLKTIELFPYRLSDDEAASVLMRSVIEIISYEIDTMESAVLKKTSCDGNKSVNLPFILAIYLLKKMIQILTKTKNVSWLQYLIANKVINRILSCLSVVLQDYSVRKVVLEMIDLLVSIAAGPCSAELLHCDIGNYLWLQLLPPKELVQTMFVPAAKHNSKWQTNDWWPIYTRGIELVTIMLQTHQFLFLKDAFMFTGVHEEFLMDSILLAKHTVDGQALVLVKVALEFVAQLTVYGKEWRLEDSQSMINLMRCVQLMLDHAVSKLVDHLNEFVQIVTICVQCLLAFSPKLINLIVDSDFLPVRWQPLVAIQFGAPKLNVDGAVPELTFGTFLTAAARVLDLKSYSFDEMQLNVTNATDRDIEAQTSQAIFSTPKRIPRTSLSSTTRSPFMKSLSVNSSISTDSATEIFSNSEKRFCLSAMEHLLTLLGSQSLLALKDINLSTREKQLIKRELSTELHTFHNFVKKRIAADQKGQLYRKHLGLDMSRLDDIDASYEEITPRSIVQSDKSDSLRVRVTRKQHLDTAQIRTPIIKRQTFDLTKCKINKSTPKRMDSGTSTSIMPISPITPIVSTSSTSSNSVMRPTLKTHRDSSTSASSTVVKRVTFSQDETKGTDCGGSNSNGNTNDTNTINIEEDIIYYDPEDPTFSGLSIVKMSDRDYLHFLSNLFDYICQNV